MDGGVPDWSPGAKVQVALGPSTMRTLTPFDWSGGRAGLLVYLAGHGPLAPWVEALQPGSQFRLFGPRRSLKLDFTVAPIMVGDETSLAVAAAWQRFGSVPARALVFEATDATQLDAAASALDLGSTSVTERQSDDAHHDELAGQVAALVRAHPDAPLVLSGRAQTVRAIRRVLKADGLSPNVRVKGYWDTNHAGLD